MNTIELLQQRKLYLQSLLADPETPKAERYGVEVRIYEIDAIFSLIERNPVKVSNRKTVK